MDPLNNLTSEAHRLASQARRAFLEVHPTKAYEHLTILWNFLTDELAGSAPEPCESDESSSGS